MRGILSAPYLIMPKQSIDLPDLPISTLRTKTAPQDGGGTYFQYSYVHSKTGTRSGSSVQWRSTCNVTAGPFKRVNAGYAFGGNYMAVHWHWGNVTENGTSKIVTRLNNGQSSNAYEYDKSNGFTGTYSVTWWSHQGQPSNATLQAGARRSYYNSIPSSSVSYLLKFDKAWWTNNSRIYRRNYTYSGMGSTSSSIYSTTFSGTTRLIDVIDDPVDGTVAVVTNGNGDTLYFYNANNGTFLHSQTTAISSIRQGAYNQALQIWALVDNNNVLSYFRNTNFSSSLKTVNLPVSPISMTWEDGLPIRYLRPQGDGYRTFTLTY